MTDLAASREHVYVASSVPGGGYEVRVSSGAWESLPALLAEVAPAHSYVVIADATVSALYGRRVAELAGRTGTRVELLDFPAGERWKTREVWAGLGDRMLAAGVGRDSVVLALGGGVTGDLAGFVAATYMRGIPAVQLPTTLLAMIDASVGGKVGVDTPTGKNLIGAFHPPRAVVADMEALRTLPAAHLRAGLAEAIKHGAIADAGYLRWIDASLPALLTGDAAALGELVVRSVRIKAEVVSSDEREAGPRKALNFGHTLGHAVEALSGYEMLHGEAVALGMVLEAELGERLGVTERGTAEALREILRRASLPTVLPVAFAPAEVVAWTRTDKKARGGIVEYALLERIGSASPGDEGRWGTRVPEECVLELLGAGTSGG